MPLPLGDWIWILGTSLVGLLVLPEVFFRKPDKVYPVVSDLIRLKV
jgi:hypothetical protein